MLPDSRMGQAMHKHLMLLGVTVAAVATAACRPPTSSSIQIAVLLEAYPTVAQLGDTVTFIVNVAANNVSGVVINFGDSSADQFSVSGAPTARVTFKHAYDTTGTYLARATVSDAVVGDRNVTQLITVTPRSDSTSLRR